MLNKNIAWGWLKYVHDTWFTDIKSCLYHLTRNRFWALITLRTKYLGLILNLNDSGSVGSHCFWATAVWVRNPLAHRTSFPEVFLCHNPVTSQSFIWQVQHNQYLKHCSEMHFLKSKKSGIDLFLSFFPIFKVDFCPWEHKFPQAILASSAAIPYTTVKYFYFSYLLCSFIHAKMTTLILLATALSWICGFHSCCFPYQSLILYWLQF